MPGFPDYTLPEQRAALEQKASEVHTETGYVVPFWRFLWVGVKE